MPHDKARRLPSSDGRRPRKRSSDEHDAKGHYCNRCHRGCRGHRVCCTFVSRLAGCLRTWATPGLARACARSMKGRRYMAKHAKRESDLSEEKLDDSTTDADGGAVSEGQDLRFRGKRCLRRDSGASCEISKNAHGFDCGVRSACRPHGGSRIFRMDARRRSARCRLPKHGPVESKLQGFRFYARCGKRCGRPQGNARACRADRENRR